MTAQLLLSAGLFVGTHLVLSHPLRAPLVRRIGEGRFLGLYSLIALATFLWMVMAARAMPPQAPIWSPSGWGWMLASLAMLVASVLLAGSFFGNPASPDPAHRLTVPDRAAGVYAITRHPMLWSFILWAAVHVLVWPTPRTAILGGAVALLSLVGARGQDRKKRRLVGDAWRGWMRRTAFVPFAGQMGGRIGWTAAWPGVRALGLGTAIWLVATWLHPIAGAPPVGIWAMG